MIAGWPGVKITLPNTTIPRPPAWTEQAACRLLDPADADRLFFPTTGQVTGEARRMCATCPVVQQCGDASFGEEGFWGGLSSRERGRTSAA